MNPSTPSVDLEQLSAWLDGELDRERSQQAEAWLATHPDDAARVQRWAADRDALRDRLAPFVDEPLPPSLEKAVRGGPARRLFWRQAAAVAGLLVTGGVVGAGLMWQGQRSGVVATVVRPGEWVQRAVYAHAVYVAEPRHMVEVKAQEEHLARWLTRRIETQVKLYDLRAQGFELVGGRLLPDGRGKSAQLMYQDAAGTRITVYLRKPEPGTMAAFRYERQGDVGMFYWVDEDCGYALAGALPRERLLALAEAIYRQESAAPASAPARGS